MAADLPSIIDPATGCLLVDSQSKEYRRFRRREWLRHQARLGYRRIDLWLSPQAFAQLCDLMLPNEPFGACMERLLESRQETEGRE